MDSSTFNTRVGDPAQLAVDELKLGLVLDFELESVLEVVLEPVVLDDEVESDMRLLLQFWLKSCQGTGTILPVMDELEEPSVPEVEELPRVPELERLEGTVSRPEVELSVAPLGVVLEPSVPEPVVLDPNDPEVEDEPPNEVAEEFRARMANST